jgi:hypothetical protein
LSDREALPVVAIEKRIEARLLLEYIGRRGLGRFALQRNACARVSDESGERQVCVQSYPEPGRRYPVSTDGGERPVSSHDGRELFYFRPQTRQTGQLMVVDVKLSPTFSAGLPRRFSADHICRR